MKKSIVIAAGGTGGHLYPAIAVAEEIRRLSPEARISFVGTRERIESREVPRAGFDFYPIDIHAPGKSFTQLLRFPIVYTKAVRRSREIFRECMPTAFLGGGAYLSLPVAQAAKGMKIPIGLLEINAVAGRANKALARNAEKIFLAYPEAAAEFASHSSSIVITGTPVRQSLEAAAMNAEDARTHFGLDPKRLTLLVFGGSLGAKSLNEALSECADRLMQEYNIIWQTGKSADTAELRKKFSGTIWISEYIHEMNTAYAASDVVVSRAGASTLAELATLGKAAILVPYPFAIKNHQEVNARAFEQANAARVLLDNELKQRFFSEVQAILRDEDAQKNMREHIALREKKDARTVVAQWLLSQ